jgi:hypothetical protein
MRLILRLRTRMTTRRILVVAGAFSLLTVLSLIFVINLSDKREARAAIAGDYRSKASGDWSNPATWERFNGTSWVNATAAPSSSDGIIEIQGIHYITITSNITIDQLIIDENGMIANTTGTITVVNGVGTDVIANGYWNISSPVSFSNSASMIISGYVFCQTNGALSLNGSSTISVNNYGVFEKDAGTITETAGHWIINSGGSYRHNQDGGNIPFASWTVGSNCEVTGSVFTAPSNLNQPFFNFSWSCASQPASLLFNGELQTVNGDFRMTSTGTGSVKLSSTGDAAISVGGNFYQDGGTVIISGNGNSTFDVNGNITMSDGSLVLTDSEANASVRINGNLAMTGGVIDMSRYSDNDSDAGIGSIYLKGNLINSGGFLTATSPGNGYGNFHFANTGSQTISASSLFGRKVNVIVDGGATLDLGAKILSGEGSFTLSADAGLIIGHFNGISLTALTGNIQMRGNRMFSRGGNYMYKGSASQLSGDGLPALVNNLTIDNPSGIILSGSVTVANTLNIASGNINTAADTLKLGVSNSMPGNLLRGSPTECTVTGWFGRWISSSSVAAYVFPLSYDGKYRAVNMAITNVPASAGYLIMHYFAIDPGHEGLPLTDGEEKINKTYADGFWTVESSLSQAVYNIEIYTEGFSAVSMYSNVHLLYRTGPSSPWATTGNHSSGTLMQSNQVVRRMAVAKASGEFAIGWKDENETTIGDPVVMEPIKFRPIAPVLITSISPNPFFENFKLDFAVTSSGNATICLMNTTGELIVQQTMTVDEGANTWQFIENVSLVPGVYYVSIEKSGSRVTKRVIKNS